MDMYQKREQRRKNKLKDKNNAENNGKMNINWHIGTYAKPLINSYKIIIFQDLVITYLSKNIKNKQANSYL